MPLTLPKKLPEPRGNPSNVGISPTTIKIERPNTKPVTIGLERKSATQPSRSNPAIIRMSPEMIANAVTRASAS